MTTPVSENRYEILPFGRGEEDAALLEETLTLTVTCSPKHGIERTIEIAERVQAGGQRAVVHLAARMIRDEDHLEALLRRMADARIDEVFLIGGDASPAQGSFDAALPVLTLMHAHELRPARIGIAGYPEGHPLIDGAALDEALAAKSELADYLVTQMCFDDRAVLAWLEDVRARGIALPAYVGVPGAVELRKLMEISMKVGVGASMSFLRKQRGLRRLMTRPKHAAEAMHASIGPLVGDPRYGIVGLHYFTFDRLRQTRAWELDLLEARRAG